MKILFISKFDLPDFQCDMIFHGLRSLFGSDVVDCNEAWYMYDDFRKYWADRVPSRGMEYGRGFTLYGKLPKLNIDRTDIESKIKNHYFDKIIYGSIWRYQNYITDVHNHYNKSDVILIDGEDVPEHKNNIYGSIGKYFKREVWNLDSEIIPLDFCIPKELIVSTVPTKTQDWATVIPGQKETYIFTDENLYFKDYQKSYFALTTEKCGWTTLRHCEILMNGCIPYFPYLENCPEWTLTGFPKKLILETNKKIQNEENILSFYEEYVTLLLEHTKKYLTTEIMVKKIL